MKWLLLSVTLPSTLVDGNNVDTFNYGFTNSPSPGGGTSYGQQDWDKVTCDNLGICTGYPNKFENGFGFNVGEENNCRRCQEGGPQNCGLHRQSPIDLKRDRGIIGHQFEKECPDWHWMQYRDDSCSWEDMEDQFEIERHSLKINIPVRPNGDIDCVREDGQRRFPRLDYSKGFPDWWWMDHMSITTPSNHIQEGTQYAAEVILAHFYQIAHPKNQLGHVVLFLDDYPDAESWPYLDKLICQWRKKEEEVRAACGEDPAPPYGRCSLFRQQPPSEEWLREAGLIGDPTEPPTVAPSDAPVTPSPTHEPSDAPVPVPTTAAPTGQPSSAPVSAPAVPSTEAPFSESFVEDPTSGPTLRPSLRPTESPSEMPQDAPTDEPTGAPSDPGFGEEGDGDDIPEELNCADYPTVNFNRMCHSSDPCCDPQRSDTSMCWDFYENIFPGELIDRACYWCCPQGPMVVGPPNPPLEGVPKTIQCSDVNNPFRVCKDNSCCESERSTSGHCQSVYNAFEEDMNQVCHYCCREPKQVGPPLRYLRSASNSSFEESPHHEDFSVAREAAKEDSSDIPDGAKVTYVNGRKMLLREENFIEEDEDEQEYFDKMYADYMHRQTEQVIHTLDYDDVEYWPYEWMLKVGTEYYFRYEGTQLQPPCWEVVHWRVMKDPIRVHERQIKELNRLLAWRLNPDTCQRDTAGNVSPDGNSVNLDREVQYYHKQHRKVFCECKDWPSKFQEDKEWCKNWKLDPGDKRFYETPYSFDTSGEW